jgi:hypothetical protein
MLDNVVTEGELLRGEEEVGSSPTPLRRSGRGCEGNLTVVSFAVAFQGWYERCQVCIKIVRNYCSEKLKIQNAPTLTVFYISLVRVLRNVLHSRKSCLLNYIQVSLCH